MADLVLGIDTSCYTTSVATVAVLDGRVVASHRQLLRVPMGQRGLRQSDGVFQHVKQLPALMEALGQDIRGHRVVAVCVSSAPRDGAGSYMPVFQVGTSFGESMASLLGIPCYPTTHQRGHLYAARVDSGLPAGDALFLHLSGGTTELLAYADGALTLLGGTADLHAGQLVDRTAVALGLPFPGGPALEALAMQGESESRLPVSMKADGIFCHLSGAETQVQRWIAADAHPPEIIAREVFDFLTRTVLRLIKRGNQQTGIRQVLIAGGVASSTLLREMIHARQQRQLRDVGICFGQPAYSGDNAVGVALIGREMWLAGEASATANHP